MARILVSAMPFSGHVGPLAAVAEELVRAGHDVVGYTGSRHTARFEAVGATPLVWRAAPDFDEHDLPATFPRLGRQGTLGVLRNISDLFVGTAAAQATDIAGEHPRSPFDLLVADAFAAGAGLVAAKTGLPFATVDPMPRMKQSRLTLAGMHLFDRPLRRQYEDFGLSTDGIAYWKSLMSRERIISASSPLLEYPDHPFDPRYAYVGRLAPTGTANSVGMPAWWPDVRAKGQPIILVTQGTFNIDPDELIRPAIESLAGRGVMVIVTTGGGDVSSLGDLPSNVRAAEWLPTQRMLPHVDVVVTNGGWGGILEALEAGVPLVVGGRDLDKPMNAARIAWSGAGVDLGTGRPSPLQVRVAVDSALRTPAYRARAVEIGAELQTLGGARAAAALLEALLPADPSTSLRDRSLSEVEGSDPG